MQFRLADLLYRRAALSFSTLNELLEIWSLSMSDFDASAPISTPAEMHALIDASTFGDAPWQCLVTRFQENVHETAPAWMQTEYEVWYRDPDTVVSQMLSNPDFDGQFDFCPYIDLDEHGNRRWNNVMSGNVAW